MERSHGAAGLLVVALVAAVLNVNTPAFALACLESCVPDPAPPPRPSSCTLPPAAPKVVISGTVKNIRGLPLQGASVYGDCLVATASANGSYNLTVLRDQAGQRITATHPDYYFQISSQLATPINPAVAVNFKLPYPVTTTVSPDAFNTSQTLTFTINSNAPQVGSKPIIQLPTGGSLVSRN